MSSDAVVTLERPDADDGTTDVPFVGVAAEGPYGFKPDRNRPIEPHFDGFGGLTPEQARQVLDVRDGRRPRCVLRLAGESVLVEHCGQGYCDPLTGQQWGYRVRRVGHLGPSPAPGTAAVETVVPIERVDVPPPPALPAEPLPVAVFEPVDPQREADPPTPPEEVAPEPDDEWTAPARLPRATALADAGERTALVRVLVLWFVVCLLLVECVTLLTVGR